MRKNDYTIDADDVFVIKPINTDSGEEDYEPAVYSVDALPCRADSADEEDWD